MLSGPAQEALIGWETHGPRIITATFKTKNRKIKMNVIQCYSPTNDSDGEDKEQFHNQLQNICRERYAEKDVTLLIGDINAKIGADNTGYEEVMGTHGLERFLETCATNNQVIGGSLSPNRRIHKYTWVSPDHVTENRQVFMGIT